MRLLEIMLAISVAACFILPLFLRRPLRWLPAAALLAGVLQYAFEGYRWQLVPLYALAAGAAILGALNARSYLRAGGARLGDSSLSSPSRPGAHQKSIKEDGRLGEGKSASRWRIAGAVMGLILTLLAILPPALLPIPKLPAPSGPDEVGTFSSMLTDTSRTEMYGAAPGGPRQLMVQFWYPADEIGGFAIAPWTDEPEIVAPAFAEWLHFPSFFLDHIRYSRTHSYVDAPTSTDEAYPVIVFSHGWRGTRFQSTFLMEELASWGYVVAAIDHSYGAQVVVFPDGSVAPNDRQALPFSEPEEILDQAADRLANQWAEDMGFVLDTLAAGGVTWPNVRVAPPLALEKVGVAGHSTGGGAAVEFCGRDSRCGALLGLDPYLVPVSETTMNAGLKAPTLFMYSETWEEHDLRDRLLAHTPQARVVRIAGTRHYDFSDLPAFSPLAPALGLKGPLQGERVLSIIRQYAVDFFDYRLRGGEGKLYEGPAAGMPEVEYER